MVLIINVIVIVITTVTVTIVAKELVTIIIVILIEMDYHPSIKKLEYLPPNSMEARKMLIKRIDTFRKEKKSILPKEGKV